VFILASFSKQIPQKYVNKLNFMASTSKISIIPNSSMKKVGTLS
jgi:hypothetical protein